MRIADRVYLNWQAEIKKKNFFRWFWRLAGIYLILLLIITCLYLIYRDPKALVLALGALVFARLVICETIYFFYKKPRPYQRIGFEQLDSKFFLSPATKRPDSMPSAHAASLSAIAVVFYWFFPLLGPAWIAGAFLNGVARVILGYHDPQDVVAGWVLGILSAFLTLYLAGIF